MVVSSSSLVDWSSSLVVSSSSTVDWSSSWAWVEVAPRRRELRLELHDVGRVLVVHRRPEQLAVGDDGHHPDVEDALLPGRRAPLHALDHDRLPVLGDPLDAGAQLDGAVGEIEIVEVAADVLGAEAEHPSRAVVRHGERPVAADDDLRAAREVVRALAQRVGCARRRRAREIGRHDADAVAHRRADDLVEDPPLDVRRAEQVGVRDEHLRLAEHEHAVVVEREVEPAQDPRLRLRVEVHERVAADEQVDPGDRGVLHEVVAAEDHRTPQIAAERVALVGALEEALERLAGHVLDGPCRVRAVARGVERLLVDVRRVDLHAVQERRLAERLGEHHRDRVGLLARRAAGAPHADRRRPAARAASSFGTTSSAR